MNSDANEPNSAPWYHSRCIVVIVMLAVILIVFIVRGHREHLAGRWIYLLLLLCPLMYLFGHGGHGKHVNLEDSNG